MRIAYIGLRGVPASYSGIERAVEEIGSRLVKVGHEVTVYCMNTAYNHRIPVYKGMSLRYVQTIPGKHSEMLLYSVLSSLYSSFQSYDIVHIHALGPAVLSFIPRCLRRKTVVTVHGLDWKREKWGPAARAYLRLGEKSSCLFPHSTIVVSRSLQKYFRATYGKDTKYIPNGVPLGIWRPFHDSKNLGIERGRYVLFVGRLTPEKNVHQLIQAYQGLSTDMKLVIVGSAGHLEGYRSTLQALAEKDERVLLAGPQYGEALAEIFSNAGLFVLPSSIEGLPIALLEAMSFGIPALVSDISENLEVIDNASERIAFTFRAGSVKDLRDALVSSLEQGDVLRRFGLQGQLLVLSKYNWDNVAHTYEYTYTNLVYGP